MAFWCLQDGKTVLNGPTSEMEHGPPNDSRGWSRLLQVTTGGFSFQITNTLTLPSILEKHFFKMKGVTRGRHLACFVDQSDSPGLSITSLCTGVHAHVISMSCLPQFRRLAVFGKLTVPHMARLSGRSSSWRQASLRETHLVPSSGCHASLSAWGAFSLF